MEGTSLYALEWKFWPQAGGWVCWGFLNQFKKKKKSLFKRYKRLPSFFGVQKKCGISTCFLHP